MAEEDLTMDMVRLILAKAIDEQGGGLARAARRLGPGLTTAAAIVIHVYTRGHR